MTQADRDVYSQSLSSDSLVSPPTKEREMTDSPPMSGAHGAVDDATQPHYPRHRREDVPVDAQPGAPLLGEFGENPDTSQAG